MLEVRIYPKDEIAYVTPNSVILFSYMGADITRKWTFTSSKHLEQPNFDMMQSIKPKRAAHILNYWRQQWL